MHLPTDANDLLLPTLGSEPGGHVGAGANTAATAPSGSSPGPTPSGSDWVSSKGNKVSLSMQLIGFDLESFDA